MAEQPGWFDDLPPLIAGALEVTLIVISLGCALYLIRMAVLRWRARSPRVQVSSVTRADPEATDLEVDPLWISSLLREQLSALRLSATDVLPEGRAGRPMMEVVEGIGEGIGDKANLGKALGRLFRAVVPAVAYEVSAIARSSAEGRGTISVQVVDHSRRGRSLATAAPGDKDWMECARDAAAAVAGALYPRVADHYKGPWTHWREPVPSNLVMLHTEARRHEEDDRLEQAMGVYHEALDRDPLNPTLRLRIAMLQERLGLDLGAWATYRAIADEEHRDSWKGADRRVRLLALYRLAILLGNSRVAASWIGKAGQDPAEEEHRRELRDALKADRLLVRASFWQRVPFLANLLPARFTATSPTRLLDDLGRADGLSTEGITAIEEARALRGDWIAKQFPLAPPDGHRERSATRVKITHLLEIVSLARLEQLDARLRRKPPWRPWRWPDWWRYRPSLHRSLRQREFSLGAVRASKLVARVRIVASAEDRLIHDEFPHLRAVRARSRLQRRWPFAPSLFRLPARLLRPRHRAADRRGDAWQYHYNAACAVARALPRDMDPSPLTRDRGHTKLVVAGIDQLEEYVHRAGSGQARAQADWVAHEDDDLAPLRATDEYTRWSSHHLPRKPTVEKPDRIDTARIAARIAHGGAQAFAASWRARAASDSLEAGSIATWWQQENAAWRALEGIFAEHRSWERRWEGIDALQACLRAGGEPALIDAAHRPEDREAASDLSDLLLDLLEELTQGGLSSSNGVATVGSWTEDRAARTHAVEERTSDAKLHAFRSWRERREALRAFRIWTSLSDALEAELDEDDEGQPGTHLINCLEEIHGEIARAHGWRSRTRRITGDLFAAARGA